MEYGVKSGNPEKQRSACVVVGVFEPRRLSHAAAQLDKASNNFLSNLVRRGDMEGKLGQSLLLTNVPDVPCERVLLIGCGRERELNDQGYRQALAVMADQLQESGAAEAVSYLPQVNVKGRDSAWRIREVVISVADSLYRFDQLQSKPDIPRRPLRKLALGVSDRRELSAAEHATQLGDAIARGMALAKELSNLPGNICTPSYLAEQAQQLADRFPALRVEVLGPKEMEELGMGALLSVARGSRQEPRLISMHYQGAGTEARPYALVGKGITFDSGGISLKPGQAMDEMKFDMCGAASVFGTIQTIAELALPANVVGVVAASENLPGGNASKPGDIVTTLSKQTVEILNTDAEGRLVLCDALAYTERHKPRAIVDIATLTGACIIALGHHAHALLGNQPALVRELLAAGNSAGDRAWELPLWDEYQEQLKSNFADMANIGGRPAGTITAACFLSRFAQKQRWAHLDIAGTAWKSGEQKGATGRPVPLLVQYLLDRVAEQR